MPLARRWALASERVTEPKAEGALDLAYFTSRRDRLGEVGGGILALEDSLPGNPDRRRRLPDRASFLQFPQDHPAAPIEFHGVRLSKARLPVHMDAAGRGAGDNRSKEVSGKGNQKVTSLGALFAHFGTPWRTRGESPERLGIAIIPLNIREKMAEGVGFEPTEPFGSPVFKTGAIDHSTTPPLR
jgi:hypothetical protein